MGEIYGENLWGKFSQQFKTLTTNDHPGSSGGGWVGYPITTRGHWRVVSDSLGIELMQNTIRWHSDSFWYRNYVFETPGQTKVMQI